MLRLSFVASITGSIILFTTHNNIIFIQLYIIVPNLLIRKSQWSCQPSTILQFPSSKKLTQTHHVGEIPML